MKPYHYCQNTSKISREAFASLLFLYRGVRLEKFNVRLRGRLARRVEPLRHNHFHFPSGNENANESRHLDQNLQFSVRKLEVLLHFRIQFNAAVKGVLPHSRFTLDRCFEMCIFMQRTSEKTLKKHSTGKSVLCFFPLPQAFVSPMIVL